MNIDSLAHSSSYFSSMFLGIWNRSSKNYKVTKKKETITLRCSLIRKKIPIPEDSEFSILPCTQNRKLRKFYLLKCLVVYEKQNKKNDLEEKTLTLRCGLRRKNVLFRGFQVFDFALYLKSKTWKPRKVFVYFNFSLLWLH